MTPLRPEPVGARPVTPIEALLPALRSGDAREEAFHRFAQMNPGQPATGKVLSRFNDGSFLVRIADADARMNLPSGTRVGDSLSLTLASRIPRLTFLLSPDTGSAATTLSPTGRLIDTLLHDAQQNGTSSAITGKTPIMNSPAMGAERMTAVLRDTLVFSGVFYESHLREWANGARTFEDLGREPQARTPAQAAQLMQSAGLPGADAPGNELAQLVNQQLNTLEHHRVMWRGEVWPGQQMEWEVSEETPDHEQETPDRPPYWRSEVRFELPALGTVTATIRLTGDRLQLDIGTLTAAAAASLRMHGAELADALDAAGIPLTALLVKQHESV